VRPLPLPEDGGTEVEALHRAVLELAARALALAQPQTPMDLSQLMAQARDPMQVVFLLGPMISLDLEKEQALLEAASRLAALTRTHLELILELPWNKGSEDTLELVKARQVLDEDHYDLEEIKDRILEHLAVLKLNPQAKAPILCLVGPPGVGKTSLGQSIARAVGRHFERASLGGLSNEAELRGHRRTYIGAMPGRIIQAIRRAGVQNPVLLLDEVDK